MLESTLPHTRTAAQRADQRLSWIRPDRAFFASGACHILAFAAAEEVARTDGRIVAVVPTAPYPGSHVFYRLGHNVFDFNGWSVESDLMARTERDYGSAYPGWGCELVDVVLDLEDFCEQFGARPPGDYFSWPIPRATAYARAMGVGDGVRASDDSGRADEACDLVSRR